jgi:hypothetical protein
VSVQTHGGLHCTEVVHTIDYPAHYICSSIVPTSEVLQVENGMPLEQIYLVKALQAVPTEWTL